MTEFKTISREANRLDLRLALASGAVAFLVYLLTISPGVYPGQSAMLMATYTGIEPQVAPTHPLWAPIVGWLGGLHLFALPLRLNLFSAVCGALAVMLVYRLVAFFMRQTIESETISDRQLNLAAALSGLTAAATLAFCVPFWEASTRLQFQSFDLLLLLAVLYLMVLYARVDRLIFMLLFALCYGLGMVESTIFIVMAPLAGVFALLALWRRGRLTNQVCLGLLMLSLLGLSSCLWFGWRFFRTADIELRGYQHVSDVLVFMLRDQFHDIRSGIPRVGWMWLLFQSLVPWLAALIAARRALNNERSWSLYLLHLILTVLAVCVLTNLSFSPWRILRASGNLPVVAYLLMAMVCGYLAAYWYLLMVVREARHDQEISNLTKRAGNWMGLVLAWPFVALVVAAIVVNAFEAAGRRGSGADICAKVMLDRMGSRTWIVTDGTLDYHLEIQARERHQPIHLLCLQEDMSRVYQRQLVKMIDQEGLFKNDHQRMLNTVDLGVLPFIQDWFISDADIARKVVVFGVPDLWYGTSTDHLPIPDELFFSGARNFNNLDVNALVADHLAFWTRMEKLLPRKPRSSEPTDVFCNNLRRHMGFIGNNLAVTLEEVGRTNEAMVVYERVRQLDPDNISVLFNLFEMARRTNDKARIAQTEKDLRDFIARQNQQYPLWSLSRYYGYIRNPEMFARLGWSWALSGQFGAALVGVHNAIGLVAGSKPSQIALQQIIASMYMLRDEKAKSEETYMHILDSDPGNRQALFSMAHLAVASGELDKARNWLQKMQDTGVQSNQMGVEWAAIHLAAGEYAQARLQLQASLDLQPNNLQAWGMLAVVLLQLGELKEVEQNVLPKMEGIAGSPDQYFIQIVRAQLAMTRGKDYYRLAREAFIRASILRPDVTRLNDIILQLDIALADQPRAEQHARQVLRVNRKHALANYVMGSLRLQTGQYGEAEDFLRRSVDSEPLPAALNDLAETLRRIRKYNDAEKFAREATVKAPDLYVAWETLASILMEESHLDEAEAALKQASQKSQDDMRVQVSMARLQYLKGDLGRAREILKLVRSRQGELNPYELADFERLAADVARRR